MIKERKTRPPVKLRVHYKLGVKIQYLILGIFLLIGFYIFLMLPIREGGFFTWIFGLVLIIYLIWLAYKNHLLELMLNPFQTAFLILDDGIMISDPTIHVKWGNIDEVVAFNLMGHKHLGIQSKNYDKENANIPSKKNVEENSLPRNGTSRFISFYLYDALSPPADDIVKYLISHYDVKFNDETRKYDTDINTTEPKNET